MNGGRRAFCARWAKIMNGNKEVGNKDVWDRTRESLAWLKGVSVLVSTNGNTSKKLEQLLVEKRVVC